jgi:hypothetical protein
VEKSLFTSFFLIIAKRMVFKGNLLFGILLSSIKLQKGRIELLKKWQEEFYKGKDFLKSFVLKLSILQLIFSIDLQQRQSKIKLYLKHGISESLMLVILKYLTVLLMLLFLLKAEISLMRKGKNLSLLAIMMNQKAFNFSILKRIIYFFPKILFL